MTSNAEASFRSALIDVDNLMAFHENEGGNGPGRRASNLGSLNKSAVVLLCAAWESYIEFVICECATRNIDAAVNPNNMLKSLQKLVSSHVRTNKDDSVWQLATGDGWRDLTKSIVGTKVGSLNTPKKEQVKSLINDILGVNDIEETWEWHKNPLGSPASKLDDFVRLRGAIAHGDPAIGSIKKSQVGSARDLIFRLVEKVEARLSNENLLA